MHRKIIKEDFKAHGSSKGLDQTVHMRSLIYTFAAHLQDHYKVYCIK